MKRYTIFYSRNGGRGFKEIEGKTFEDCKKQAADFVSDPEIKNYYAVANNDK